MISGFRFAFHLVLGIVLGAATMAGARAQEIRNTSYAAPDKTRVLQHSIVIPATRQQVWDAFTTTEGVRTWAVPVASVDFRLGGIWESSYSRTGSVGEPGNIKNKFLSFIPMRMIAMQAINAPPAFPHPEALADVFTIIEMEELGPQSIRVTSSMVGFKNTEAHEAVYLFFDSGNAATLRSLYQRFVNGPVDWDKSQLGRE